MHSYLNLLRDILANGKPTKDRTGTGTRYIFGYQWRHDMTTGFPLLTTKKMFMRGVFEELRWFLSGSTDNNELTALGVNIWKDWSTPEQCAKFGREPGDLGPVYGALWRRFNVGFESVDQIAALLDSVKHNPQSRRHIVTGWHPRDCNLVALPPCHTLYQLDCSEDREMSLHLYARSIDAFLGLPFNIASYALLLEMLCYVCNYRAKDLIISFGNLHIYNNHMEQVTTQIKRPPLGLCQVDVSPNFEPGSYDLEDLLAIEWKHIKRYGYDCHPAIKGDVSV